jgi:peptidoglycan hydrolase CwlO-like protein
MEIVMTRVKEPSIGTSKVPEYKSPPSRIIKSLRKGYDNLRGRVAEKSELVQSLQGKLRDTQESRDDWKARAKAAETEIETLKKENIRLQTSLKKRP